MGLDAEGLERLAIQRGCDYYQRRENLYKIPLFIPDPSITRATKNFTGNSLPNPDRRG
jgi:hypothetical protein